jgi:hypothetical protein
MPRHRIYPTVTIGRELEDGTEQIIVCEYEIDPPDDSVGAPKWVHIYPPEGIELTLAEHDRAWMLAVEDDRERSGWGDDD